MDRNRFICAGIVFCLETVVAIFDYDDHRCTRWNAAERMAQAPGPSAPAVCRGPFCGLVRLQFCQRPHDWRHSAVRTAFAFRAADLEGTPLATPLCFQRCVACPFGG